MSDYSVSPEGGFWEEADRPTLSDAIQEAVSALNARWVIGTTDSTVRRIVDATEALISRAEEADQMLKEYR